jgi:transcriptional regulator with XRE-family HTH domain
VVGYDSSVRRRWLAGELRQLRTRAGLTAEDAAKQLGWSGSKLIRIELHRSRVKPADLDRLLDLYQVSEPQRGLLAAIAQGSRGRNWWETYSMPKWLTNYIAQEAEAVSVLDRAMEFIPGLLQTADYSRAVLQLAPTTRIPPGQIERMVEVRMHRQERLAGDKPLRLVVVADEAVLLRRFGTPAVMRAQLQQLIEVSHWPNVTLRVMPLAADHPVGFGGFQILEFDTDGPALNDVVWLEHLNLLQLYEDESETYQYRLAFDQIVAASLDPDPSRDLIARIASGHRP